MCGENGTIGFIIMILMGLMAAAFVVSLIRSVLRWLAEEL